MAPDQGDMIAEGTVTVRALDGGREWDEKIEVFEADLDDPHVATPEDAARNVARSQTSGQIETLECDIQ